MNIPNYENSSIIGVGGVWSDAWSLIMQQLITQLQRNVGTEGFVISDVSSDPASVSPPTAGGQLQVLQDTFGQQDGVKAGTLVFDPYEVNGGSPRNGQLKILLNDGVFHGITNT